MFTQSFGIAHTERSNMYTTYFVLALLLFGCISASGQSAFEGFYAQAGLGAETFLPTATNESLEVKNGPFAGTYTRTSTYPRTFDFTGTVTVGAMGRITDNFLLGVGIEWEPTPAGIDTVITTGQSGVETKSTYEQRFHFNFFLSPAYVLDENRLVYGKIGYHQSHSDVDFDGGVTPDHIAEGLGIGVGYKQIVAGGLYFFGEANYYHLVPTDYQVSSVSTAGAVFVSNATISSTGYSMYFGLGYTF